MGEKLYIGEDQSLATSQQSFFKTGKDITLDRTFYITPQEPTLEIATARLSRLGIKSPWEATPDSTFGWGLPKTPQIGLETKGVVTRTGKSGTWKIGKGSELEATKDTGTIISGVKKTGVTTIYGQAVDLFKIKTSPSPSSKIGLYSPSTTSSTTTSGYGFLSSFFGTTGKKPSTSTIAGVGIILPTKLPTTKTTSTATIGKGIFFPTKLPTTKTTSTTTSGGIILSNRPIPSKPVPPPIIIGSPPIPPPISPSPIPPSPIPPSPIPPSPIPPSPIPPSPIPPSTIPSRTPSIIPSPIILWGKKTIPKNKPKKQGYIPQAKSKGKWKNLSKQPMSRDAALGRMSRTMDNTLSAQGRIKKAKGKISTKTDTYFGSVKHKLRPYKIRKGVPIKMHNQFIEKATGGFRLDTIGERKGIRVAKFAKQMNWLNKKSIKKKKIKKVKKK